MMIYILTPQEGESLRKHLVICCNSSNKFISKFLYIVRVAQAVSMGLYGLMNSLAFFANPGVREVVIWSWFKITEENPALATTEMASKAQNFDSVVIRGPPAPTAKKINKGSHKRQLSDFNDSTFNNAELVIMPSVNGQEMDVEENHSKRIPESGLNEEQNEDYMDDEPPEEYYSSGEDDHNHGVVNFDTIIEQENVVHISSAKESKLDEILGRITDTEEESP